MRPSDAERAQQVAREGGLAGAERAAQLDDRVAQRGPASPALRRWPAHAASSGQRCCVLSRIGRMVFEASRQRHRSRAAGRVVARRGPWAGIFTDRYRRESISPRPKRACCAWLDNGFHGAMDYMARHGVSARGPRELVPGTVSVITARLRLPAARRADGWQAIEWRRIGEPDAGHGLAVRARPRLSQGAALAAAAAGRRAGRRRSGRSAIASSPIRRRCSKSSWRRAAASAGAASTRWRCRAMPARCSSSARSTSTSTLPPSAAGRRALRQLQRLHRHLPDASDRRAVPARCAALHLVPDDRASGADSGRAAAADRQPHLRLRRLPARLPVEQVRAAFARCPTSTRATASTPRRCSSCGRGARPSSCAHRRQRDPPHRLRALAAQPRGRRSAMRCAPAATRSIAVALAGAARGGERRWCASTSTGRCEQGA